MAQTLLSPAQVDELVALYEPGATLGERFSVHRRIAAAPRPSLGPNPQARS
ncbi:hypothetical protein [Rhodococcus sp. I2R]|uniref:hypothetical protein n=1 Tax=Rhodococcus sp. I2R TaxID=2855445 RepID=UPI001E435235|nr:hypothetical protein [Rhodococcus sp. I2R]MCC8927318.1 hypothetical protein [Rhodococcus sp. I2R]